ncbi:AbaSI family restriction endonuclease [Streptococcus sp. E24BD]|uniref:AbaSI family restriction endonuclease n=1 Tax=Streptococcus sp. E24BD TaxID=3278715 RepID=UPI00359CECD3
MTKEITELEYYANLMTKISHKKYEYYVVSRIIHLLDDFEIEFTTQQVVRKPNGNYLMDLFFPQFNIAVEIDEPYHIKNFELDKYREKEIINLTGITIKRITITDLYDVDEQIKRLVQEIRNCKNSKIKSNQFMPFQFDKRFDVQQWIDRGKLKVTDNAKFRTHVDVLKLFGKDYKGHQRATWKILENTQVWFPKLYSNRDWTNELIDDVKIIQTKNDGIMLIENIVKNSIVFAHQTDVFGKTYHVFKGVFECVKADSESIEYNRVSEVLDLKTFL